MRILFFLTAVFAFKLPGFNESELLEKLNVAETRADLLQILTRVQSDLDLPMVLARESPVDFESLYWSRIFQHSQRPPSRSGKLNLFLKIQLINDDRSLCGKKHVVHRLIYELMFNF